ncbi:hypothetical protein B0T25DRAFT_536337 [Lasiosphaeria hispida]|uniref:Uncharacterized protein n=1 Tax=Lasiosphaeria hispida TaxID=260671 RepID=A0AAJ0HSR7_9PEZI|nr:hypothetical protein B0T25DRAFT_536337 [Lasiosphaeria hispida]
MYAIGGKIHMSTSFPMGPQTTTDTLVTITRLEMSFESATFDRILDECPDPDPLKQPSSIYLLQQSHRHVRSDYLKGLANSIHSLFTSYVPAPGKFVLNAVLVLGGRLDGRDSWRFKSTWRTRRKMLKRVRVLLVEDGTGPVLDTACRVPETVRMAVSDSESSSSGALPFSPLHLAVELGHVDRHALFAAQQKQADMEDGAEDIQSTDPGWNQ